MNENLQALGAFFLILLASIFSQQAEAAMALTPTVPGYSGGNFTGAAGSFSMMPANEGYIKPSVVSVGGKAVTVPATLRMAANAGTFVKSAMRLNPWAIAGTLAAGYLVDAGMTWMSDTQTWRKTNPGTETWGIISGCPMAPKATFLSCVTAKFPGFTWTVEKRVGQNGMLRKNGVDYTTVTWTAGTPTYTTATDADWAALPDPSSTVASELPDVAYSPDGAPVDLPWYEFTPFSVPVGEPYTRPDESTVQPMAKISPNGDQVTVDTYDQPLTNPDGTPATDPTPQDTAEPQEAKDPCIDHPERLGCAEFGTPAAPEALQTITPGTDADYSAIGGAGSCPADVTVRGITWSYQPICNFATAINPLILGFAWLSFAFIVAGAVKS